MHDQHSNAQPETARQTALPTRRDVLVHGGSGFGALALSSLLLENPLQGGDSGGSLSPMVSKPKHYPAKAKSVIFLFMEGAPSHIDLFDPKPLVNKLDGQPIPPGFKGHLQAMNAEEAGSRIMAAPRTWKQHGESGLWVSEWLPHIATCVDDIALIHSCVTDGFNHAGGIVQMNTGSPIGHRWEVGSATDWGPRTKTCPPTSSFWTTT